jgi:Protein of unknown function (DUF3631)
MQWGCLPSTEPVEDAVTPSLLGRVGRDLADDSVEVDLLRRCWQAFDDSRAERLQTVDLLTSICTREDESRFRGWWWDDRESKPNGKAARQLALRLGKFGIRPERMMEAGERRRGYSRQSFEKTWPSTGLKFRRQNPL